MPSTRPSPAQAAPTLLALPPEVLLHILAAVPQADRLSSVALVCKQLHGLCSAPPLLSSLDVQISGEQVVPRTESLLRLFASHGEHVRSLQLDIYMEDEEEPPEGLEFEDLASMVTATLAACGARQAQQGGGLQQLIITPGTPLLGTCVPLLTALEELHLAGRSSEFRLLLSDSWRQLTALRSARLSGYLQCHGSGPCLPPSLTRLCIEGDLECPSTDPSLDARVLAGLPALRCLELSESNYTSASLAGVSGLTALTRLVLSRCDHFPPAEALAALAPSLLALEVHSMVDHEELYDCVQALTGLESLALDIGFDRADDLVMGLRPSAFQLPRLRRLLISAYKYTTGSPGPGLLLFNQPAGPYLHSLRSIALPLVSALAAHPLLAQAGQLHTLCLQLPDMEAVYESHHWPAFWQLLATHPPLRRLLYEVAFGTSNCPFRLLDALLVLKEQRPDLQVQRLMSRPNRMYRMPTCWGEMHP